MAGRPASLTTAVRLLRILRRVEAGARVNAADLAGELGVSTRTAQRYLRALRDELGLPVRTYSRR